MKLFIQLCIFCLLFFSFGSCKQNKEVTDTDTPKNEVLVLGTIHSGHLTDSVYSVSYLEKLIRVIQPDYILAEIPPDRFEEAVRGLKRMIVFQSQGCSVFQNM